MTQISISTKYKNLPKSYLKYYEKGSEIIASRKQERKSRASAFKTLVIGLSASLAILFLALLV